MRNLIPIALSIATALAMVGCATQADTAVESISIGLGNTYWALTQLGGVAMGAKTPRQVHLVFDPATRRVSGSSGCNRLTGAYDQQGEQLHFGQLAGTRMACHEGMDTEQMFLQSLQRVRRWSIVEQQLSLLDASGQTLARFQAQPAPQ
jgi:heat shock protein HslJ